MIKLTEDEHKVLYRLYQRAGSREEFDRSITPYLNRKPKGPGRPSEGLSRAELRVVKIAAEKMQGEPGLSRNRAILNAYETVNNEDPEKFERLFGVRFKDVHAKSYIVEKLERHCNDLEERIAESTLPDRVYLGDHLVRRSKVREHMQRRQEADAAARRAASRAMSHRDQPK